MISSNNPCSILYLDCRGYFDLAADIITAVVAFFVLIRSLHNLRELKLEQNNQNQPQYADTIKRKIIINVINIVYIFTFEAHLAFSMILFQVINEMGIEGILQHKLNLWYKFSQVFFVEFLNCLLITVGWLYWKGLYSFYKVKGLSPPFLYRQKFQYVFFVNIAIMIGVIIVGVVNPFVQGQTFKVLLNWLLVMSEAFAVTIFLSFRLLYYKNILCSVKLNKKTIRKQKIHNFVILLTSFGRVALCILSLSNLDFQSLRDYDTTLCHDMKPYNAILLLLIGVVIDLIPPFIFTRIFVTLQRQTNNQVDETLFSALPSEYTVYTT